MKKTIAAVAVLLTVAALFSSCSASGGRFSGMNYKLRDDGTVVITGYSDKTTVTELVVPDEIDGKPVVGIEDFGICNAESLTKLTIGKNVREIAGWALTNNQHITEDVVAEGNESFVSVDGVIFSADMKTLYCYPCGRDVEFDRFGQNLNTTTYSIPDGVEVIRTKAFYKCYYVDVDYFPDTITDIQEKAFHKASALTD
ncbi:MAG: leucine-rich repeat domain-containing protein, partial [Clostridia bacterium]|nr:leucine-rich repeat domain-containing protein [Clostridia bacterium]